MFFGRTLNFEEIDRLRAEREEADRQYNGALTALDHAIPGLPEFPHPPLGYDEQQITPLNERFEILNEPPSGPRPRWRRWISGVLWRLVAPALAEEAPAALQRQQEFNASLVNHLNRNVMVHRSTRDSIETVISVWRGQMEAFASFHGHLITYLQAITPYVDTKDRNETLAGLLLGLATSVKALDAVNDDHRLRWEAMIARDQHRDQQYAEADRQQAEADRKSAAALDDIRTTVASVQQMGLVLKRELERLLAAPSAAMARTAGADRASGPGSEPAAGAALVNDYKYLGFEDKFRGSEAEIRERMLVYLPYFEGLRDVLEIGCGRGEFLTLLGEKGVAARGLDINHEMVERCRSRGLTVDEGDALAYLRARPDGSLGGIFAAQVVEHFTPDYLMRFLDTAYHKLRPGSRIILETLNPACWSAFFDSYIRDVTHAWPLHPETLTYLAVASGFQKAEVLYLSPYPRDARLQSAPMLQDVGLRLETRDLVEAFNRNVEILNGRMFSDRDYAVVGERL